MDQANASVILSLRFECFKTCVEKLRVICALAGCGYQVEKIQCVDMFGWTRAVETVCLLSKRKPDSYVHLNLKMEDYYRIKDARRSRTRIKVYGQGDESLTEKIRSRESQNSCSDDSRVGSEVVKMFTPEERLLRFQNRISLKLCRSLSGLLRN